MHTVSRDLHLVIGDLQASYTTSNWRPLATVTDFAIGLIILLYSTTIFIYLCGIGLWRILLRIVIVQGYT